MGELGIAQELVATVCGDSLSAISLGRDQMHVDRTKHINFTIVY